jgi:DNA-binding transcriptional regulator YiaG
MQKETNWSLKIQKILDELEITQEELGKLIGVHSATIYRWLSRASLPEKRKIPYLELMLLLIDQGKGELLKKKMRKALTVGGYLAATYNLLRLHFEGK